MMMHAIHSLVELSKRRPWASLLLVGLLVLAGILIGSGVKLATSQDQRAGVVVQFGDGSVQTACVNLNSADSNRDGNTSGEEVLRAAGFDLVVEVSSMGPAICKVGPDGCNFPQNNCFCECSLAPGSDCRYWSYSRLEGGAWRTSGLGAGSTRVQAGGLEGWVWGYGTANQGAQPPLYSFDDVCMLEVASPTITASATQTASLTASATNTPLPTYTALPTNTALPTYTALPSFTPPPSATNQPSPSFTVAPQASQSTATASLTATQDRSVLNEIKPSYIYLPYLIHIATQSEGPAIAQEQQAPEPREAEQLEPVEPTATALPSPTATLTLLPSPSSTALPSHTAALSATPSPTHTATARSTSQPSAQPSAVLVAANTQPPEAKEPSFGSYLAFFVIFGGLISFWLAARHLQGRL
jgi:hypothetical protein